MSNNKSEHGLPYKFCKDNYYRDDLTKTERILNLVSAGVYLILFIMSLYLFFLIITRRKNLDKSTYIPIGIFAILSVSTRLLWFLDPLKSMINGDYDDFILAGRLYTVVYAIG